MTPNNQSPITTIGARQNCRSEILHWDGRLDNRDALSLRLKDSLSADPTDAAIALACYQRWGIAGLVHLIGDWSLVIRDRTSGDTILASDFAGVRPLYYHVRRGGVAWSSRLQTLVEETGITDLDEQYIAGFLMFGGCPNRTPYKEIYSVPPGHAVCVSAEGTGICKFWEMPTGDVIRYQSDRQYQERLRDLFREAVAVRLQAGSPVVAELSGGLDSSSVVCLANHLMRTGAVNAPSLSGVSFVWPNSLDEPFINEVESHCGIEGVHVSIHDAPVVTSAQAGGVLPEPYQPLRSAVAREARRLAARTVLTGQNGDLMMGNWFDDSLQVAGSLGRLRVGRACEEALAWRKILGLPIYRVLWRGLQAALPPSLTPISVYGLTDGSYAPRNTETSLSPDFAGRTGLSDPTNFFSNTWMQAVPERRKHFQALATMLELRLLQPPEPLQHLEYTHPFAHRPLVEFLMAIPAEVLCQPGEPRKLMRATFSGLWPASLRARRSKALFNVPWQEALRPIARTLLQTKHLQLVERGVVDDKGFRSRLERLCAGPDCNETQLRQIVLLELWLRNRENGQSSRTGVAA